MHMHSALRSRSSAVRQAAAAGFARASASHTASTSLPATARALSSRAPLCAAQQEKDEGSIASVFSSLGGDAFVPLEQRFADLKKSVWNDGLIESWRTLLGALEHRTEEIIERGNAAIPQVSYADIKGFPPKTLEEIKRVGTVVVHGAVQSDEALAWKKQLQEYVARNRALAKGYPVDNPQVWEVYNSVAQTQARTHPGVLGTQRALLSLFYTSDPDSPVSVTTPISYYDRFRIRFPGDAKFTLGPHVDGGSLERWEDPVYRSAWRNILSGGPDPHVRHDAWDLSPRLEAKADLYNGAGACSVFRMFQGWTAISDTSPNEGTLRVFPDVNLATAYIILRPFFRPRRGREGRLAFDDWEIDVESTEFPGSVKGKAQELSDQTHPHLRLSETMTSVPRVQPGSQVYWHCDVVHSVEAQHRGLGDSSVLYIPAAPLTGPSAKYLLTQRTRFERGVPAPDFPGGAGESSFVGRATVEDAHEGSGKMGRAAIGYARFEAGEGETEGGRRVIDEANRILGHA
ncbi:hypothetical protein Rhopal_007399-T1 [Rhodotorula paludigena]|uniref:DUF1479-domain-containing protein n=1 Tax=Rhodotorula paludigena TaxID=86838 RepID=A0AAV5GP23_9BASI|nr:hypothetical protein Rhopal_007399-T1 [Rhodotorula paludigena]